jgi:hypothetical protein
MSSQGAANLVLIAFHPVLFGHAFSLKYPGFPQAGHRFVKIAAKINPSSRRKLVGIAQQLILQERLSPSISSLQLLSRVQAAVSSAVQNGISLCSLNAGGDIAAIAFIVLMMALDDANLDLQSIMAQVKAQTAAKEAIRSILNELNQIEAASAAGGLSSVGYCAAVARIKSKFTRYH